MEFKLSEEHLSNIKKLIVKRLFIPVFVALLILILFAVFFLQMSLAILSVLFLIVIYFLYLYQIHFFKKTSSFEITDIGIKIKNKLYSWDSLKSWRILGPRWLKNDSFFAITPTRGFDFVDNFFYIISLYKITGIRIYFGNPFYNISTLFRYVNLTVTEDKFNDLVSILEKNIGKELDLTSQIISGLWLRRYARGIVYFIFFIPVLVIIIVLISLLLSKI